MGKYLRSDYFRANPDVRRVRHAMGTQVFDDMYRSLYRFLITLHIGQYFVISKMCKNNPENHDLVIMMCDIYHNMDFNVNLSWDEELDRITVLPTTDGRTSGPYAPVDVYSMIVKNPEAYGVSPEDI